MNLEGCKISRTSVENFLFCEFTWYTPPLRGFLLKEAMEIKVTVPNGGYIQRSDGSFCDEILWVTFQAGFRRILSDKVSLETMVLYDKIFNYSKNFDKKLQDPFWETVSRRIKKYNPFLNIDVLKFRKILKEIILEDQ